MKNIKLAICTLFISVLAQSCSKNEDVNSDIVISDHKYEFKINSGFISGLERKGSIPNKDYSGLYFENQGSEVINVALGNTETEIHVGGAVVLNNDQANSTLNNEYDVNSGGSTLLIQFKESGQDYSFISVSGSITVSNLQKYGVSGTGVYGASYILNFDGLFKQANYQGLDEEAPIVGINGRIDIKKVKVE